MPRLTRRVAACAVLATGGTLVAALVTRKWPGRPDSDTAAEPPLASFGLQGMAAIRPVEPPARLPAYRWQEVGSHGTSRPRSIADYAGQGVVLNIWATWCGPCTREMPSLARLATELAPTGIAVLPVSIDHTGAPAIRTFFDANAVAGLPVLVDPDANAMSALGIGAIPVTLLIGPDGTVRGRLDGGADWGGAAAARIIAGLIGR